MGRHVVAPLYLVDGLAVSLIFTVLHERILFALQILFILGCIRSLASTPHFKILTISMTLLAVAIRPLPQFYSILHFISLTVLATVVVGQRKGSYELLLCHGASFFIFYLYNTLSLLSRGKGFSVGEFLSFPSIINDSILDRWPFLTRSLVPFAVAWLGILKLYEGDTRKSRQPWLWKQAAAFKVAFWGTESANVLNYRIRFVQNHLVGILFDRPYTDLFVNVDAVEWTQIWIENDLLIIYGLSPCVDYSVHIGDGHGVHCDFTISTFVPGNGTDTGVKRQTPMKTLLEARGIAVDTLAEEKLKSRKLRKEHNKILTGLRHEIDTHSAKCSRNAKTDERTTRKLLSLQESIKQLQEEIKEVQLSTTELESGKPESDAAYSRREKEFSQETDRLTKGIAAMEYSIASLVERKSFLEQELSKMDTRKVKQGQKLAKLEEEIKSMQTYTQTTINKILTKREAARQAKHKRRLTQQAEFEATIKKLELGVAEIQYKARQFDEVNSKW